MIKKGYVDRINYTGLNALISQTTGIEPVPKNSNTFILSVHFILLHSKVS